MLLSINERNIDMILGILYGEFITPKNKEKIKVVLLGNTMNSKGTIKTIASIIGKDYKYIEDTGTGTNINDIHVVDRGDAYQKTILSYRNDYYWASYGELVENNIFCYK